jgi:hypothetical protein
VPIVNHEATDHAADHGGIAGESAAAPRPVRQTLTVAAAAHDRGQPDIVKDIIAKRIIEIGKTGERDAKRICERAMLDLGLRGK